MHSRLVDYPKCVLRLLFVGVDLTVFQCLFFYHHSGCSEPYFVPLSSNALIECGAKYTDL